MARKSPREIEAEFQYKINRNQNIAQILTVFLKTLIKWGGLGFIAYMLFLSTKELAGKTTDAKIVYFFRLIENFKLDAIIPLVFGIMGVSYGILQRVLRRREIGNWENHKKQLELKIDPNRKSSGLSKNGSTRKEDKQ